MTTVGIVGGTGPAGRGVAVRLASGGYEVVLGSRDAQRAIEVAGGLVLRGSGHVRGDSNEGAAGEEIVIVATPFESAIETATSLRGLLTGKIVVSMVNALAREGRELIPLYPPRGSVAAQLAHALPESRLVGAFHHLPAAQMEDLDSGLDADVIIFGDHADSRRVVGEMIDAAPGLRAIEAGSLSLASAVEAFTAVCISINIRHRAHSYVRLAGLGE